MNSNVQPKALKTFINIGAGSGTFFNMLSMIQPSLRDDNEKMTLRWTESQADGAMWS